MGQTAKTGVLLNDSEIQRFNDSEIRRLPESGVHRFPRPGEDSQRGESLSPVLEEYLGEFLDLRRPDK